MATVLVAILRRYCQRWQGWEVETVKHELEGTGKLQQKFTSSKPA
jgi:hypothetical protein